MYRDDSLAGVTDPTPDRGSVFGQSVTPVSQPGGGMKKIEAENQQTRERQRADFENRFRRYIPAQRLLPFVTDEQMDVFFLIAEEYRRDSLNQPAVGENKQGLLDDARKSAAFISGIKKRLDKIQGFISKTATSEHEAASILAQDVQALIASVQRRLEEEFEFENRRIDALTRRLSTTTAQHAALEFTIELQRFVRKYFPRLTSTQKRKLVAAAMAGAGCFTKPELWATTQPRRFRMRLARAKKYQRKAYPEGRFYIHRTLLGKKKQEATGPGGMVTVLTARRKKQKPGAGKGKAG
jgi:hypothetical protein